MNDQKSCPSSGPVFISWFNHIYDCMSPHIAVEDTLFLIVYENRCAVHCYRSLKTEQVNSYKLVLNTGVSLMIIIGLCMGFSEGLKGWYYMNLLPNSKPYIVRSKHPINQTLSSPFQSNDLFF